MAKESWITLSEFSSKYRVSVSTLRRRIKTDKAEYKLDGGKYWLRDTTLSNHKPLKVNYPNPKKDAAPPHTLSTSSEELESVNTTPPTAGDMNSQLISTVNGMMEELKKAYMQILQEKEHQIFSLKGEIADLKTLIKVMEDKAEDQKEKASQSLLKRNRNSWLDLDN